MKNNKALIIIGCIVASLITMIIITLIIPFGNSIHGYVDLSKHKSEREAKEFLEKYIEDKYDDDVTLTLNMKEKVTKCTKASGLGCHKTAYYIGAKHYVFDVQSTKLNKSYRVYYIDAYRDVVGGKYHDIDFSYGKEEYE